MLGGKQREISVDVKVSRAPRGADSQPSEEGWMGDVTPGRRADGEVSEV